MAVCDRLKISTGADNHTDLMENIQGAMTLLFTDLYEEGELHEFSFNHAIAFRITEINPSDTVEVTPNTIIVKE